MIDMNIRQSYTCPRCNVIYGEVKSITELNPLEYCDEPCLISWCQFKGFVYEFMPEARE